MKYKTLWGTEINIDPGENDIWLNRHENKVLIYKNGIWEDLKMKLPVSDALKEEYIKIIETEKDYLGLK